MEASSFKKSVEEWLVELNDTQAEHRRDALTALAGLANLDNRLADELKLVARGDPDSKSKFLARKVLKSHGIKFLPQTSYQPGVKQTRLLFSSEFWMGFFLYTILNFILFFILFLGRQSFSLIANRNIIALQLGLNIVLLFYFRLTRKNIALGMLAAFGFFVVILICSILSLFRCFLDGCP